MPPEQAFQSDSTETLRLSGRLRLGMKFVALRWNISVYDTVSIGALTRFVSVGKINSYCTGEIFKHHSAIIIIIRKIATKTLLTDMKSTLVSQYHPDLPSSSPRHSSRHVNARYITMTIPSKK